MSGPRVVIVDDHQLFRAGVRTELEGLVDIVGDAATVDAAVETIAAVEPDVVLLDVHMPDGGGVEVIRRVAGDQPGVRFLALSVSDAAAGRDRRDQSGSARLRDQVDLGPGAGGRGAARARGRRGLLSATRRLRARRLRGPRPARRATTRSSTSSRRASARCCS